MRFKYITHNVLSKEISRELLRFTAQSYEFPLKSAVVEDSSQAQGMLKEKYSLSFDSAL